MLLNQKNNQEAQQYDGAISGYCKGLTEVTKDAKLPTQSKQPEASFPSEEQLWPKNHWHNQPQFPPGRTDALNIPDYIQNRILTPSPKNLYDSVCLCRT